MSDKPITFWWCDHCEEEVDGGRVTFQEHHDACGHAVRCIEQAAEVDPRDAEIASLRSSLEAMRRERDEEVEARCSNNLEWQRKLDAVNRAYGETRAQLARAQDTARIKGELYEEMRTGLLQARAALEEAQAEAGAAVDLLRAWKAAFESGNLIVDENDEPYAYELVGRDVRPLATRTNKLLSGSSGREMGERMDHALAVCRLLREGQGKTARDLPADHAAQIEQHLRAALRDEESKQP